MGKLEVGQPGFTKIVVGCNDEQELYIIKEKADKANVINSLIIDNGVTEFNNVLTPRFVFLFRTR